MSFEKQVQNYWTAFTDKSAYLMGDLISDNYIEHDVDVEDGKMALLNRVDMGLKAVEIARLFQDNQYVVSHTLLVTNDDQRLVSFDIFKFNNDSLITEHWNNVTAETDPTPSGHTQLDGPTVPDNSDTEEAKKSAKSAVQKALVGGPHMDKLDEVFGIEYIQHHVGVPDGIDTVKKALPMLVKAGKASIYNEIHMVLGKGNLVLVVSDGTQAGQAIAFYDLFRVDSGKVVEHWDIVNPIPDKSQQKNRHGKF